MSLQTDFNKIVGNTKNFTENEKTNPVSILTGSSNNDFNKFQKFRKLLSECSITDGVTIESVLSEIKGMTEDGFDFTKFTSDPQRITCFSTAIIGMGIAISDKSSEIYQQLKTYKRGFAPYLSNILESMFQEFNPGNVTADFKNTLKNTVTTIADIGIGFALYEISGTTTSLDNQINEIVTKNVQKIGKYISFLFTASSEFKYLFYLIFLQNVKDQVKGRIDLLVKLNTSIKNLVYDISNNNESNNKFGKSVTLTNYLSALGTLENILPLNKKLEKDIRNFNTFNKVINDGIIGNLDKAKLQLVTERNKFLETILKKDIGVFEDGTLEYSFVLPNAIQTSKLQLLEGNPPLLVNLIDISTILIKGNTDPVDYVLTNKDDLNLWITFNVNKSLDNYTHIRINKFLYKIQSKNLSTNVDKSGGTNYEMKLSLYNPAFVVDTRLIENTGKLTFYKELLPTDYRIANKKLRIDIDNKTYIYTEDTNEQRLNSITLTNTGLSKLKYEWNDSKSWDIIAYLNYSGRKSILQINGEYPNLQENKPSSADKAFSELPEPLNMLYSDYKYYKDASDNSQSTFIEDYLKTGGNISEFLFGKDIVNGAFDKLGNSKLSYTKFIESATNLLQVFCPLKSTVFGFYNLLDQLSNIQNIEDTVTQKTNTEWILKINNIIEGTILNMTAKTPSGNYATIEQIKDSPFYSQLLPSIILDYDNLTNLKTLAEFNDTLGQTLNISNTVKYKFIPITDLLKYVNSGAIQKLKDKELKAWERLNVSLTSTILLMLKGESIVTIKPLIDSIEKDLKVLILGLTDLYSYLLRIDFESFKSQDNFMNLLSDIGLEHWVDYIRNGQFDTFVKEDVSKWMGKYSKTIECINSLAGSYFTGVEKSFLLNVANYLSFLDVGNLLTMIDTGELGLVNSVNVNFLTKIPKAPIESLKKDISDLQAFRAVANILNTKKNNAK